MDVGAIAEMTDRPEDMNLLLREAQAGSQHAADLLMQEVYRDLHRIAGRYMHSERRDHTLQPTALINEAFMRLFPGSHQVGESAKLSPVDCQSRSHFLGLAARQMRLVLIDHSRNKKAQKREGIRVSLDDVMSLSSSRQDEDFEQLNDLLELLASKDPDAAKVVELKFFGGLTDKEAAEAMGTSFSQIRRHWEFARAWLRMQLTR